MTCCDASTGHTTTKGLASPGRINTVVLSAAVRADARVGTVARRDGGQRGRGHDDLRQPRPLGALLRPVDRRLESAPPSYLKLVGSPGESPAGRRD